MAIRSALTADTVKPTGTMVSWRRLEQRLPTISRNRLRVMNKWLFWLWVFPGIPISIYLRNSVAWVVFLSAYAIIIAHLIEWRQEDESNDAEGS